MARDVREPLPVLLETLWKGCPAPAVPTGSWEQHGASSSSSCLSSWALSQLSGAPRDVTVALAIK